MSTFSLLRQPSLYLFSRSLFPSLSLSLLLTLRRNDHTEGSEVVKSSTSRTPSSWQQLSLYYCATVYIYRGSGIFMMLIVRQTLYDCGPFITEDGCSPETSRNSKILKSFDILRLLFHRIIFSVLFTLKSFIYITCLCTYISIAV